MSAADAERAFEKVRKELKATRLATKKSYMDLIKAARAIKNSGRSVDKLLAKRWKLFDTCMKKTIKDALSLKKENEYALPLGCVSVRFPCVEPGLFDELLRKISDAAYSGAEKVAAEGSEDDVSDEPDVELDGGGAVETDDRRALIVGAVDFAFERQVDRWNTRAEEGCAMRELGRADIVQLWKRSNTR